MVWLGNISHHQVLLCLLSLSPFREIHKLLDWLFLTVKMGVKVDFLWPLVEKNFASFGVYFDYYFCLKILALHVST